MKNIIVQLRIFRGKVTYDAKGKITSDVQTMKLKFGRLEWVNFIKTARLIYSKIDVVMCTDLGKDYREKPKEIDTPDEVLSDIETALKGKGVVLTPQEQEIKDLKDDIAELKGKKSKKEVEEKKEENTGGDELESLRAKYTELYGKKPNHLMKEAGLKKKIEEKS